MKRHKGQTARIIPTALTAQTIEKIQNLRVKINQIL